MTAQERKPAMQLVLSLFPGIGLLDMAFEEEGFCIVRGPDVLWGGDIRKFHPPAGKFDGVIGGPPCQCFSSLAHMVRHNGHQPKFGNLIPEFERCVQEAEPQWFLMEEVVRTPQPKVTDYGVHTFVLNNRQLGEAQNRKRRLSFGYRGSRQILMIDVVALESRDFEYAACGGTHGEGGISREQRGVGPAAEAARNRKRGSGKEKASLRRPSSWLGSNLKSGGSFKTLCRLQGLPEDFLTDAPFTVAAKCKAVGNGVPLAMGRALAKAIAELEDA